MCVFPSPWSVALARLEISDYSTFSFIVEVSKSEYIHFAKAITKSKTTKSHQGFKHGTLSTLCLGHNIIDLSLKICNILTLDQAVNQEMHLCK